VERNQQMARRLLGLGSDMAKCVFIRVDENKNVSKQSSNKFYSLGYGVVSQFKES
jgi:hypothetical protein